MTQNEFTDLVEEIFDDAKQELSVAIKSRLVCDKSSTADKPKRPPVFRRIKRRIWTSAKV